MARAWLDGRGCQGVVLSIITAERSPLELLGEVASDTVHMLLGNGRIRLRTGVEPIRAEDGAVVLARGEPVEADQIVALPSAVGPAISGLPEHGEGFLPVDEFARVIGAPDVYAAGDVTAGWPKQGGLAAQQADTASDAILAQLGYLDEPTPFEPDLRGVLLVGEILEVLESLARDGHPTAAEWRPPTKIVARHLGSYLGTREPVSRHPELWRSDVPAEIEVG